MATTLAQLLADAQKRKFTQLVSFIQDIDDKLTLKQIDAVIILDPAEQPPAKDNTLYFKVGNCIDYETDGNLVIFEDAQKMFTLSYYFSLLLRDHEKDWYEKIIDTFLRFGNITLKDPNIMHMITCFNDIMKNPVIVYDEFWNITVSTDTYLDLYARHEDTLQKLYIKNTYYYKQRVTFLNGTAPVKECTRLLFPVTFEDTIPKGYLAIFDVETPYEDMDLMLLEIFSNSVLVEMKRLLSMQSIETKFISDFLYDVIYRKTDKIAEITRKASLLNIEKNADYCIIAINPLGQIANFRLDTNGYISQHEFMYDRIMNNIKNYHTKTFPQDIVSKFDNATYILHKISWAPDRPHDEKSALYDMKEFCYKLNNILDELFDGMDFQIGIGGIVNGLINISGSFQQAWAAISYGEILYGKKQGFIISYQDNSFLKLFGRLQETEALGEIIPENLIRLYQYDEKNGQQLYETLKMYLDCNCNARKAADRLYIHYKTILHRLDKIKNNFGIDIENSNSRLYIELGIQLLDLKKNSKILNLG